MQDKDLDFGVSLKFLNKCFSFSNSVVNVKNYLKKSYSIRQYFKNLGLYVKNVPVSRERGRYQ